MGVEQESILARNRRLNFPFMVEARLSSPPKRVQKAGSNRSLVPRCYDFRPSENWLLPHCAWGRKGLSTAKAKSPPLMGAGLSQEPSLLILASGALWAWRYLALKVLLVQGKDKMRGWGEEEGREWERGDNGSKK